MDPFPVLVRQGPGARRLGNKLLQVAFARYLGEGLARPVQVHGFDIPQFSPWIPYLPWPDVERPLILDRGQCNRSDLLHIRYLVDAGQHDSIIIEGWATTLASIRPSRHWMTEMFDTINFDAPRLPEGKLLISLRMAEILKDPPKHVDYSPLPVAFYQEIVRETGLEPVFVGQLTDSAYLAGLARAFPTADFVEPPIMQAFEMIRRARHKVVSISTFSWLAAWLGDADTHIILPIAGLFNPMQRADVDLLPWSDRRYEFRWFAPLPRSAGTPLSQHLEEWHTASDGYSVLGRAKS